MYILLFGWNPTSAIKWVHLPRILTRAIERGARLVVVDPYLSDTAAKAHEWVSIRPGTDGAMALALAHVIVKEKLYDQEFVAKWTKGFTEYSEYLKDKTPEWAEGITSVPGVAIARIARELATTKPACVDVWSGPGQHSNGVQVGELLQCWPLSSVAWINQEPSCCPTRVATNMGTATLTPEAAKALKMPRYDEKGKVPVRTRIGRTLNFLRTWPKAKDLTNQSNVHCVSKSRDVCSWLGECCKGVGES